MAKLIQQYQHPKLPKLYVQQRDDSRFLQAVTYIDSVKRQKSMGTEHLPTAFRLAEDWLKKLHRASAGETITSRIINVPIMEELFKSWRKELSGKKLGWADMKWGPIAAFWETKVVTEINASTFKEFYRWRRAQKTRFDEAPKNHTIHKDVILLRQILKYAIEEEHISVLPAVPKIGRIQDNPRPLLTAQEWEHLRKMSEERIHTSDNHRLMEQRIDLDDQMMWMVATMMRVGEMLAVRFRDCRIEKNAQGVKILLCDVKGKRGMRIVVGRGAASKIYTRRKAKYEDPSALIFPVHHHEALTELLKAAELHVDHRSGFTRDFKSFRATAISRAILRSPNPNLLMIARNAGTSVAVIDRFYAQRLSAEMGKDLLTEKST